MNCNWMAQFCFIINTISEPICQWQIELISYDVIGRNSISRRRVVGGEGESYDMILMILSACRVLLISTEMVSREIRSNENVTTNGSECEAYQTSTDYFPHLPNESYIPELLLLMYFLSKYLFLWIIILYLFEKQSNRHRNIMNPLAQPPSVGI